MELKRYWQIIRRYWWIVAILTLVGVVASYQYYKSHPPAFKAKMVVSIRQQIVPNNQNPQTDRYFADVKLSSEYATDDFIHVVQGNVFENDVSKALKQQSNIDLSAEQIQAMLNVGRVDRELIIEVNDATQNNIIPVVRAMNAVFSDKQKTASYLDYGDNANHPIEASTLDLPTSATENGGRTLLLAAIYVIVGLLAGVVIAFLLAYLDDKVRTPSELRELLGLPILAVIPSYKAGTNGPANNTNPASLSTSLDEPEKTQTRR